MKRIWRFIFTLFIVCIGCFFYTTPKAMAVSQQEALNWVYAQEGKYLDWDNYPPDNPYQCVDLIKYYYDIFGMADYAMGNGYKYTTNDLPPGWTRIQNYAEFIPEPGDIGVWTSAVGDGAGHVAIILEADVHTFVSMDQSWPSGSPCTQVSHGYSNFWGVVRPKYDPDNHWPVGNFEGAVGEEGRIHIWGWAKDDDTPDQAVELHIYVDGPAGEGGTCIKTGIMADQYRSDVGSHGFDVTFSTSVRGSHPIYVYAINTQSGHNPALDNSPRTVNVKTPEAPKVTGGNMELLSSTVFRFTVNATDNVGVTDVNVNYWYDKWSADHVTTGMVKTGNNTWIYDVPFSLHELENGKVRNADIRVYDAAGNQALRSSGGTCISAYVKYDTVSFDARGGNTVSNRKVLMGRLAVENQPSKNVGNYGFLASLPTTSKHGYTFGGWYTAAEGGSRVTDDTIVGSSDNHTLYAHWTANKYTVTFNPNEGSVNPTSKAVTFDAAYGTLPAPTREGYTFDGWYTAATGGTKVTNTTVVKTASNHTLYAHWKDAEAPEVTGGNLEILSDKLCRFTIDASDKVGVDHVDIHTWYDTWTSAGETIYKAQKTGNSWYYEIPYDLKNGKVFRMDARVFDAAGNQALDASGNTMISGMLKYDKITFETKGGECSETERIVLYAHYNIRGKGITPVSTYGKLSELPTPTSGSYKFAGWFKTASGEELITSTSIVNTEEDHTLYAVWRDAEAPAIHDAVLTNTTEQNATLTLKITDNIGVDHVDVHVWHGDYTADRGNAIIYSATRSGQSDQWIVQIPLSLTNNEAWYLNVWPYDAQGNKPMKDNGGSYVVCGFKLLTVTFDSNGGNCDTAEKSIVYTSLSLYPNDTIYTSHYATLPVPTRNGYTFDGWYTAATGGTKVTETTVVKTASNHTLYAVWQQITPDLTLPAALTTIESEAFANGGFASVLIPPTVKTIALDAFGARTDLIILGTSGSYAETFAGLKHFTFVPAA